MLLTLDIGNSAVKGGLFDGDELSTIFSTEPPPEPAKQSSAAHWRKALAARLDDVRLSQVGLVSVVPPRTEAVKTALRALTDAPITTIRTDLELPFILDYETPETLGTDRLAAAAAGWLQYGRPNARGVLVVDAGTAVNYEVIHPDGVYRGGAIDAGPALARSALRKGTAQLPKVPLTPPDNPVGQSTQTALQSGIMWGFVDGVRGMADRLARSFPDTPQLVLTGGWSSLLSQHLDRAHDHAPHLVLHGVRLLTLLNR